MLARWYQCTHPNGVNSGAAIEWLPSLFSRAWHVMAFDGRFQTFDHFPLLGEALVFGQAAGGVHDQRAEAIADLERTGRLAARHLLAKSLRSVDLRYLKTNRNRLTEHEYDCAYHLVGEIQRVVFSEKALRDEDHRQAGYFLSLSHESSIRWIGFRDAMDDWVEHARSIQGCLGATRTGSEGSAFVAVVPYHEVSGFVDRLNDRLGAGPKPVAAPSVLQIVDGVG
jgi:galactokinase